MKKMLLLMVFCMFSVVTLAQNYPHVSIRDIQYIDPGSLTNYFNFPASPYAVSGDTIIVTGVVMESPYMDPSNPDTVIMYVGNHAGCFIQDTAQGSGAWDGIFAIHFNDVAGEPFSTLDSGLVVNFTGVVSEYFNAPNQKTTELGVINFSAQNVVGQMQRPQPIKLTIDSLKNPDNTSKAISVKWEGVYVEIDSVTTLNRNIGNTGSFQVMDENGLILNIYSRSDYLYNYDPPADNTKLSYIRGYIETRADGDGGGVSLLPAYREDFEVAAYPPDITNVSRDPAVVGYGDGVYITADISDQDGQVDSARIIWRKNGGAYTVTPMMDSTTTIWTANLPAQNDSSFIDYFIWAKDNDGNVATNPSDTSRSRYTYFVLDHDLTIQHVQYSPFGSGYSSYNGYEVTVRGIVTADTTDLEGNETGASTTAMVYIQNGQGPWSGIRIVGTDVNDQYRGYDLTVTGVVSEYYGVTQIGSGSDPATVFVNSTGNALPAAEPLSTADIDLLANGVREAEQWEGVLVKYQNVTVTNENADGDPGPYVAGGNENYGDILVADASNSNTRVDLQDGTHQYHNFWFPDQDTIPIYVRTESTFQSITGIMWYSHSYYKLIPRKNDDFVGFVSDVKEPPVNNQLSFDLSQNYPNPFNPSTIISYRVPDAGLVTLKVYNILGQEVKTLVNNYQNPGSYKVTFNASSLPSGVYLYRLTADKFVQVKKMILMK